MLYKGATQQKLNNEQMLIKKKLFWLLCSPKNKSFFL